MSGKDTANGFGIGFLVGAAVGLAIGIMYAPRPGRETREIVRRKTSEAKDRAEQVIRDARERAEEVIQKGRSKSAPTGGGEKRVPESNSTE